MASIGMAEPYRGPSIRADFEDVLDTVRRGSAPFGEGGVGGEEAAPHAGAPASFAFLQALDAVSEQRSTGLAAGALAERYGDAGIEVIAEESSSEARPSPPEPTLRGEPLAKRDAEPSPVSLAAELGLRAGLKPAELRRLRRAFALENHPDRLAPSRREAASRRMTIANSLIDEALRRTRAPR
jgi:hypothetical protein